jgi:hypothetical protein
VYVKYTANPPAIGRMFTITMCGDPCSIMIASSEILLGLVMFRTRQLSHRYAMKTSVVISAIAFLCGARRERATLAEEPVPAA